MSPHSALYGRNQPFVYYRIDISIFLYYWVNVTLVCMGLMSPLYYMGDVIRLCIGLILSQSLLWGEYSPCVYSVDVPLSVI